VKRGVRADDPIPTALGAQLRRHLVPYAIGTALLATYQAMSYGFDRGLWYGIDSAIAGNEPRALRVGVLLVAAAAVAAAVRVFSRIFFFSGGREVEYELRRVLLEKLHALGPAFFRKMPTGEIMSRATNDLTQVRLLLGFAVLNAVNTVFALASSLSVVLAISVKLTLASLCTLPLLAIATRRYSKATFVLTRQNQGALGKLSDRVQSSLAGMRVVKSFGIEQEELSSFQEVNRDYLESSLALARLRGSMGPITQALGAAGMVVIFVYGTNLVIEREITAGGFVAFFWAFQRLVWPLFALGFVVGLMARGRAAYGRLRDIFDAVPDVTDGPLAPPGPAPGAIDVRGLSFSFSERGPEILRGVSLHIPAHGSLALVGRTGSGKSTLAALLPRLLPTPRGTVFLDGTDVCDLPVSYVRRAIGYAQQDAFLFSTTVAKNVGFALDDPSAPDAAAVILARADDAGVLDEMRRLPDGLDTVVGERGVQLSGGQKQRVALARSLVWQAPVLVLDDPISAVDSRTEAAILNTISREAEKRTVLLITHRVDAAKRCSRIAVLDEGRVVEQGTHDELISRGGLYARFAEEQRIEGEIVAMTEAP
jgi:ATP-binding cassette subfamily B multidrug efflux pump